MLLSFQKFRFDLIHEDARISWCKLISDRRFWNLLLNFSVKFKIIILEYKFIIRSSVEIFLDFLFLGLLLIPSDQSRDTRIQSYNIRSDKYRVFWKVSDLIFLRKSHESLMHDQLLCMTGFKWWSKNSDAFSVGAPQLDIMGRPGMLKSLWILSRKYNFSKLVAFL